ncbi:MAG: aldo/keto reductase [Candidatus Heimdallarchaeota archaeon]|nr:aldo/keto reductase [Candidatus Heimdallarchaeota archaeon]
MKKIKLKNSSKEVNRLGMGCFPLGGPFGRDGNYYAYGEVDKKIALQLLDYAYNQGINLYDTADVYGVGRSEKILGEAFHDRWDELVIATKFASTFIEGDPASGGEKNTSPEYIRKALDDSMRRLQTDFIDIYQLHSSQHEPEDAVKVKEVLDDLVQEGRIGGYGWSTDDPERMEVFADGANSVQFILNVLYKNDAMQGIIDQHDLVGLIRSPLASGTLTGKYTKDYVIEDKKHMLAKVDMKNERRVLINEKLGEMRAIFKDGNRTLVQGHLGYILGKGERIIPIPGSKSMDQLKENLGTLDYGPLSRDEMNQLDAIFADLQATLFDKGKMDDRYLLKKK